MKSNNTHTAKKPEESNERLLEAQTLAKIGHWELNVDEGIVMWSDIVFDIFECDPETFIPTIDTTRNLVHPEDAPLVKAEEVNALSSGYFNLTHRIITKNNVVKYIQQIASKVEDSDELIFRGTIQDITPLKETEKALALEKKRLDIIISSSNLGTYDWDQKQNLYIYNEYYANILGYDKSELSVLKIEEWFQSVHPDDLADMQNYLLDRKNQAVIKYEFEIRLKHKLGHWVWVLSNGQVEGLSDDLVPTEHSGIVLDITERKKSQLELDRTKELLQQTNFITKTGGWNWDLLAGTIDWTENTKNICEVEDDFQPTYEEIFDFIVNKNEIPQLKSRIETSVQLNEKFVFELQLRSGKGNKFWAKIIGIPEVSNTQLRKLYGTIQNIDDQKKNEFQLYEKTKQYNELVENIPIGVYKLKQNGDLHYQSPQFKKMIGRDDVEIDTNQFATEVVHPDDLDMFLKANNYALNNYQYFNLEFRILVDGQTKWVRATSQPNKDVHGNWYWFGSLSDITDQKNAELKIQDNERQLQNIIGSMQEAVLFYDENGIIRSINDSTEQIVKIDKSKILGSHLMPDVLNLLDADGKEISIDDHPVNVALREKKSFTDIRVQLFNTLTGNKIWIAANIKITEQDSKDWALVTFNDISARVKSEKQLITAKKAAEAANEAKSAFLANMSHEIRTPLNGVIGFSDLLKATNLNVLQSDYTNHIYNSAHSLLGIINDILDFSKIEAGKLNLQIEEINGLKVVEESISFITFQASQKNIELIIDYDPTCPITFKADELRLRQILINLLGNAVKFTHEGFIKIKVSKPDEAEKLKFEVIDTGIGISKTQQKKIFSAFEQADASTTRKFGGSGLGLTISNKLLKMMDSHLVVESDENQGSNFGFSIDIDDRDKSLPSNILNKPLKHIKKVLIVEDNEQQVNTLKKFFEAIKLDSMFALSAVEANKIIASEKEKIDLLIIDETMANISGIEMLDMFKERQLFQNQPIIFLHKHIDSEYFYSEYVEDPNIFKLPKPIFPSKLLSLIKIIDAGDNLNLTQEHQEQAQREQYIDINKILIAEDNEVNKFLITRILENTLPHAELIHAENGEIAVEEYKKNKPDLILMDIQMPIMSGIEATEVIRAIENPIQRIPIIALSAGVLKEEQDKAKAAGVDEFLEKPLIQKDLLKAFDKLKLEGKIAHKAENANYSQQLKAFNKSDLLSRLNNNKEHYASFIILARDNMKTFERQIQETVEIENLQALRTVLHKLKGTALAACFENLGSLIDQFKRPSFYNKEVTKYMKSKIIPELKRLIKLLNEET